LREERQHKMREYDKNSAFETACRTCGYARDANGHLVLRDTDADGTPGPLDCIKTRGLDIKQKWLGDVVHLQNVTTQTFEIFFINNPGNKDLSKWISKLKEFADVGGWHDELDLYGIKIPKCRIVSIEAPTSENRNNDAIGRGQINITIEQKECGDLADLDNRSRSVTQQCYECITENGQTTEQYIDALDLDTAIEYCQGYGHGSAQWVSCQKANLNPTSTTTKNDYKGLNTLLSQYCEYIEDISEEFNFDYGKGENIEIEHSVNVRLFDACPKGVNHEITFNSTDGAGNAYSDKPGTPGRNVPPGVDSNNDGIIEPTSGASVCRTGQPDIDDALDLARKMLDLNVPYFGIAFHAGVLQEIDTKNVVSYYTESQNLITGEASMTKKLTLLKHRDDNLNWSADYTHSLTIDTGGIATVSEKGSVRGYKKVPTVNPEKVNDTSYQNALDGMDEVMGSNFSLAEQRCVDFWEKHREFFKNHYDGANEPAKNDPTYGLDNLDLHVEHPLEKTRSFDSVSQRCSYSISFTTAPNIFEKFMADRVLTASRDEAGAISVSEKNNLVQYVPKGEDHNFVENDGTVTANKADDIIDNPIQIIFPEDFANSKTRAMAFYNGLSSDFTAPDDGCPEPLKIMSRDVSWGPNGRNLNYTIKWSTDKSISCSYPDPHGVRKAETESSDKIPERTRQEHPIANWKMLVHDAQQTGLGERSVKLTATLDRIPKANTLVNPVFPEKSLKRLADLAEQEILNIFNDHPKLVADNMFVKSCKYSFNSKNEATFDVVVGYIQQR